MSKIWPSESYMHPTKSIPETTNRPDLILNTRDIKGAVTTMPAAFTQSRGTNPLEPRYAVPGHSEPPSKPGGGPRFVRDSIDISDIEGTAPFRPQITREGFTTLGAEDIEGASVGWKPYYRAHFNTANGQRDHINVGDINTESRRRFATREPYPDGDVEGSKPRPAVRERLDGTMLNLSLRCDDIRGAQTYKTKETINDPWAGKIQRRDPAPVAPTTGPAGAALAATGSTFGTHVATRHKAAVAREDQRREKAAYAVGAMKGISADITTVQSLRTTLARYDRDGSGKVTGPEFRAAVASSRLPAREREVLSGLEGGLTDTAELVNYKPLVTALTANATKGGKAAGIARPVSTVAAQENSSRAGSAGAGPDGLLTPRSRPQSAPCIPASARTRRSLSGTRPQQTTARPAKVAFGGNSTASPEPTARRLEGPHEMSIAQVVARAGEHAEQRQQRAQSARRASFKQAMTEDGKPKYWFGKMGATPATSQINAAWRASSDPTMLGMNQGLTTAAGEVVKETTVAPNRPRTAAATGSRPGTASRQQGTMHTGRAGQHRPQTASSGRGGVQSFKAQAAMRSKDVRMLPTPTYRPPPNAARYTSGRSRDAEFLRQDIATVRNLL